MSRVPLRLQTLCVLEWQAGHSSSSRPPRGAAGCCTLSLPLKPSYSVALQSAHTKLHLYDLLLDHDYGRTRR